MGKVSFWVMTDFTCIVQPSGGELSGIVDMYKMVVSSMGVGQPILNDFLDVPDPFAYETSFDHGIVFGTDKTAEQHIGINVQNVVLGEIGG